MLIRNNQRGFSLVELLIVIAIIAIVAAIAIPGLLRAQLTTNEGATIGNLKTILNAQSQAKASAIVDQDSDGIGEYALLNELSGYSTKRINGSNTGSKITPSILNVSLAAKFDGFVSTVGYSNDGAAIKSGYCIKIFLPGFGNSPDTISDRKDEVPNGDATPEVCDPQEESWTAYAWPKQLGRSGKRVFVVDQEAQIFVASNDNTLYDGSNGERTPESISAYVVAQQKIVQETVAQDGQRWNPIN